ncbi:MAG: hypothetical protein DRG09_00095 [Epsilonproteobacteria bacterium]|nr:MAG: hypothetical protein DRG09_00095 [Campylobacterota bacterium]
MKKILLAGLISLPMLMNTALMADEIEDQIHAGIKAYQNKEYKIAADELKFAMAQIDKLVQDDNKKLLPLALDGWTRETDDNAAQAAMSMLGGGTTIGANYLRDNENIHIQIIANSPMIAMVGMMINNPMMAAADKNTKPYRYKRIKGIKKTEGKNTEITLLLAGQIMVKIDGKNLKNSAVLEQYLDAIDMKKLKMSLL